MVQGSHNFKFDVEIHPVRLYTDRPGGTTYTFPSLAALLASTPSQIQVLGDISGPDPFNNGATGNRFLKQTYSIFYAQDEWKIRRNLTMSYGLRYEYYSVLHEDRNLAVHFDATNGVLVDPAKPWYNSSKLNFGPRLAFSWPPERCHDKTVFRIGGGYFFGPGQTEDQVQPIDSDRSTVVLTNTAFPIIPSAVLATFNPSKLSGYQPRGYAANYQIQKRFCPTRFQCSRNCPAKRFLTVAYVGSQGHNLFLRSWTNGIVGVGMNPTTGVAVPVLQFGSQFEARGPGSRS